MSKFIDDVIEAKRELFTLKIEKQFEELRVPELIDKISELREEKRATQIFAKNARNRKRSNLFCIVFMSILLIIYIIVTFAHAEFSFVDFWSEITGPWSKDVFNPEPGFNFDALKAIKPIHFFVMLCIIALLRFINIHKITSRLLEQESLRIVKFDELIFLKELDSPNLEEKALKQLLERSTRLDTYHKTNISHMKKIFRWGITIICIGIIITVAVVVYTLFNPEKIDLVVAISGFLSGLLVDAIGAIFILMYSKTMESANAYEKGLAASATNHLGNLIATRIEDTSVRENALAEIAKELVKAKPSQSEKS